MSAGTSLASLARPLASVIAGGAALALVLFLASRSGGYFREDYLLAGAIALAVLAVVLVLRPPHFPLSTEARVGIAGLLGLAAWMGLSALWSLTPDTAIADMERTITYAAIFALGLIAAGSGRYARQLVWAALLAGTIIVGAGLVSRLYPNLLHTVPSELADYRLAYPFGYWNAFGALAAVSAVLALGIAADPRWNPALRAVAAGLAVPLATAMYLSLSRGAWLALGAGLVVLFVLSARRWSALLALALVGGGFAAATLILQGYPALVDDPSVGAGQVAEGRGFGSALALLSLAVALVQGVIAAGRASHGLMVGLRRVVRPILLGIAGVLVLGALGVYLVESEAVDREGAQGLASVESFLDRQWQEFLQPSPVEASGTERLTTASGTRSDLYRVAIDGFEAHPWRGDGSGSFQHRFALQRDTPEYVRDAHSLPLEVLSELGLVGFLFLALFIGSLVTVTVRARLRPSSMGRSQVAAVGAACAVWLAHSAVDWDWQMPALTGLALVLAGSLYPEGRRPAQRLRRLLASTRGGGERRRGTGMERGA